MSNQFKCPHCNTTNQIGAQFCKGCGQPLESQKKTSKSNGGNIVNWVTKKVNKVLDVADDFLDAVTSSDDPGNAAPRPQSNIPKAVPNQEATVRTTKKLTPKKTGETISYYQILETRQLGRSNYYKVFGYRCESCQKENRNSVDLICVRCQQPLRKYVLRESLVNSPLNDVEQSRVKGLSAQIQGVLTHNVIFYIGSIQYIVLDGFPDPWFSLGEDQYLPVSDVDRAISWLIQLGNAIKQLYQIGYSFYDENKMTDWMEPLLVLKNQQVYIADITSYTRLQPDSDATQLKDIFYLTKVLYSIVTGDRQNVSRITGQLFEVPNPFREVILQSRSGGFKTIDEFVNAVQKTPPEPEMARSLRQLVGYATDIGKQRDHNEDYVSKFSLGLEQMPGTPEVGLYIVADGMGGHQAGEKASEAVIKDVVINRIQEQLQKLQAVPKLKRATIRLGDVLTPGEILKEAIEQANRVLLKARDASSGRDRGTTITAALIVGETCSIANVGDSRTYIVRDGKLVQITQDHSLVASMVASNMIKPSEVRSHPQRNQIFRTLGDKPDVEVDIFTKTLKPGDQLLLCSDGLWEMVLDDAIAKILQNSRTPQSACDRLIDSANVGGGEDNISAIVIWLE